MVQVCTFIFSLSKSRCDAFHLNSVDNKCYMRWNKYINAWFHSARIHIVIIDLGNMKKCLKVQYNLTRHQELNQVWSIVFASFCRYVPNVLKWCWFFWLNLVTFNANHRWNSKRERKKETKKLSENISTLHDDESNNQKIRTIFRTSKFYQCEWCNIHAQAERRRAKPSQTKPCLTKSSHGKRKWMWKMKWLFLRCETEDSLELPILNELL